MSLDPKRLWASNGFDRYRTPRRGRSACYVVVTLVIFWGFALLGAAMLLWYLILAIRNFL